MGFVAFCLNRFQATVINDIWFEICFFSGIAAMVASVSHFTPAELGISNQLLTVLGTVLGLVVSFRTSSAYERYQDGRKLWTAIQLMSRNLASLIWIHVPTERAAKPGEDPSRNRRLEAIIEKKSMINLVQAFGVSVKHFLRGEGGPFYEDLHPLISFLPRFAAHHQGVPEHESLPVWHGAPRREPSSAAATLNGGDLEKGVSRDDPVLLPARNPPASTIYDMLPFLILLKPLIQPIVRLIKHSNKEGERTNLLGRKRKVLVAEGNIPLEISLFLHSYYAFVLKQGWLAVAPANAFLNSLNSLQDAVANLERVRNTPIPFAYQAHLRMCMWMYLFLLPFQIYNAYGWLTIPATAFASFLLLGFLEIGQEIEDPFGYDMNDLDIDSICIAIGRELHEITAHPAPEPSSYIFTAENQPFAPADRRTAKDIVDDVAHEYHGADTGMGSVHRTLLANWREVNTLTRKK
ncbi:UPF0187-domain-containing protein [Exidia glandulosa HHB12029]|uniref:UPF0187-domain-containing protein n=1 Tax=Exidia glandulosa HHB12029 TaxID=1314781 RepID=A0A165G926_EXIGL|nr:UPF0187-domain-containing protein [Exidia glandulosa HHB12029]